MQKETVILNVGGKNPAEDAVFFHGKGFAGFITKETSRDLVAQLKVQRRGEFKLQFTSKAGRSFYEPVLTRFIIEGNNDFALKDTGTYEYPEYHFSLRKLYSCGLPNVSAKTEYVRIPDEEIVANSHIADRDATLILDGFDTWLLSTERYSGLKQGLIFAGNIYYKDLEGKALHKLKADPAITLTQIGGRYTVTPASPKKFVSVTRTVTETGTISPNGYVDFLFTESTKYKVLADAWYNNQKIGYVFITAYDRVEKMKMLKPAEMRFVKDVPTKGKPKNVSKESFGLFDNLATSYLPYSPDGKLLVETDDVEKAEFFAETPLGVKVYGYTS